MSTTRKTVLALVVCAATVGLAMGMRARPATHAAANERYRPADTATAALIGQRVTAYWQARSRMDLQGAYPFYEAAFRARYQPEVFVTTFQRLNRFGPIFEGIDRIEVDAAGTHAKVYLKLRATSPVDGAPLTSTLEDIWLLADGTWWRKAEAMTPTV